MYPIRARMFGSLIVHPIEIRSPIWATVRSQYRVKRSTISGDSHAPNSATHRGLEKWWNVTTGCTPVGGTILAVDPNLGALADNGGPTQTRRPQAGSPAIDAYAATGSPLTCVSAADQRGLSRPQPANGRCDLGARLLSTDDVGEAQAIAAELDALNKQRQEIEKATCEEAVALVESDARLREAPVLVVAREGWHPGVIGIVASRLKDRYHRPAIVIALNEGVGKGSGRSVTGVDLGSVVVAAREQDLLVNGGGHAMAAGLTIAPEKLEAFAAFMNERIGNDGLNSPEGRVLSLEGALRFEGATPELCALIAKVGPFGAGNREPVFAFAGVRIVHAAIVG